MKRTQDAYTMKEINAEIKRLGCTITKRNVTLAGAATYRVEGSDGFNPSVLYTKSDLIEDLFIK